jgi:hypothetical protein
MGDELLDQGRRVLAVAVHEQDGAEAGMVEAGEQRRFLAEIARERDDLDIERIGGQGARCGERPVAAAVVDIDHLDREAAGRLERPGGLDDAGVQGGEVPRLVEQGHHDRKAGVGPYACRACRAADSGLDCHIGRHVPALPAVFPSGPLL